MLRPLRHRRSNHAALRVGGLVIALAAVLGFALGRTTDAGGGAEDGAQEPAAHEPTEEELEQHRREYETKAGMLLKFVKYVEWPSDRFRGAESPLVIGIYGEDPFGDTLDKILRGKRIGKRGFVIRRLKKLEGARICHILFVPASRRGEMKEIRKAVAGISVLLVGESPGFAETGGIINFYTRQDKSIHFEINPDAAKRERLKVSSNLLKLARIVKDRKEVR